MSIEKNAVTAVAGLMALAARTAPKGKGMDTILVRILKDPERKKLADRLAELGNKQGIGFFLRDAKNLTAADGCLLIGARGRTIVGLDCGACGYETCASKTTACAHKKKTLSRSPVRIVSSG